MNEERKTKSKILKQNKLKKERKTQSKIAKQNKLKKENIVKYKSLIKPQSKVIEEFRKVHGNKYDYSKVKYVNSLTKVKIICKEHGEFLQLVGNHRRGIGCPTCGQIRRNKIYWKKNPHPQKLTDKT